MKGQGLHNGRAMLSFARQQGNMSEALIVPDNNGLEPVRQAENDDQVLELWIRSKRSEHSRRAYLRAWRLFWEFCQEPIQKIGIRHLQDFQEHLRGRELSDASIRQIGGAIKSLMTFAFRVGYVPFNPGAAVVLPAVYSLAGKRTLTEEQVLKLIVSCDSKRDALVLRMLYVTAARLNELRLVRWDDIQPRNLDSGKVAGQVILTGKGSKQRVVILPAGVYADLVEWQANSTNKDGYIFPGPSGGPLNPGIFWRIAKRAGRKIGVPEFSPHWLRHSHASHALERKCNLQLISETLGHSSLMATSVYVHARPDDSSSLYLAVD